ncbi:HD domain-containing protein [Candidatus Shapirobacteria bacterium]|nr:HD domain-containing protein [Candidatus Shapirobacteria bacterium]
MMIPEETISLFERLVNDAREKAKDEHILEMIQWKVDHTWRVVETGKEILEGEKGQDWDVGRAMGAFLLHDVGRFEQALLGSYSDKQTGVSHAFLGAEMLVKAGYKDNEIIEAVHDHSLAVYEGSNVYTKLIKDADQLTIIGEEYLLEKHPEQKIASEEVIKTIERGVKLDTSISVGQIDHLLSYWNWKKFLYFSTSKEIFRNRKYDEMLLGKLRLFDKSGKTEEWLRKSTDLLATTV